MSEYEMYHCKAYDPARLSDDVKKLYGDPHAKNRKGLFEYIPCGSVDTKIYYVRVFDQASRKSVFAIQ
jgi:hypothetical protein